MYFHKLPFDKDYGFNLMPNFFGFKNPDFWIGALKKLSWGIFFITIILGVIIGRNLSYETGGLGFIISILIFFVVPFIGLTGAMVYLNKAADIRSMRADIRAIREMMEEQK